MGLIAGGLALALGGAAMGAGKKAKVPGFKKVDVEGEQKAAIAGNLSSFDKASELASKATAADQATLIAQLEKSIPGYQNLISKLSSNIQSDLAGTVNPDVEAALQRSSAGKALAGGFGGGSGAGRALSARDFGLTSMQIQNQGFNKALNFIQNQRSAATVQPFSVANMFVTPNQRLNIALSENQTQFQRDSAAAQVAAQPDPLLSAFGGAFSSLGGTLVGGGLSRSFGRMAGGGGGSSAPNSSGLTFYAPTGSPAIGTPEWYALPGNNY